MEMSLVKRRSQGDGATMQNYDNLAHFWLLDISGEAPPWAGLLEGKAIRGR
jgi:hypothetical protein